MELDFRNRNSGRQPFSDFLKRRFPLFSRQRIFRILFRKPPLPKLRKSRTWRKRSFPFSFRREFRFSCRKKLRPCFFHCFPILFNLFSLFKIHSGSKRSLSYFSNPSVPINGSAPTLAFLPGGTLSSFCFGLFSPCGFVRFRPFVHRFFHGRMVCGFMDILPAPMDFIISSFSLVIVSGLPASTVNSRP